MSSKKICAICAAGAIFLGGCTPRSALPTVEQLESDEAMSAQPKSANGGKTAKSAQTPSPIPTNDAGATLLPTGEQTPPRPSVAIVATPTPPQQTPDTRSPDTRFGEPSILMFITPNASSGISDIDRAYIVAGILNPQLSIINEKRNEDIFGKWKPTTNIDIQQILEWNGDIFLLGMFDIPGYSENYDISAGISFQWNRSNRIWDFYPAATGLYVRKQWYRSSQVEQIRKDFLEPLTGGRGWKYSIADARTPGKVTLNTPQGTQILDIASLETQIPVCTLTGCGSGYVSKLSAGESASIFTGKIIECSQGWALVYAKEESGNTENLSDGSGFTPRWLTVSVWTQKNSQTEWVKYTNFRADSGDTVFIERIPSGPFGNENVIAIFGDINKPILVSEEELFK